MDEDIDLSLEPGDFLYEPERELFLVVMEENDDSFTLAAHGWRNIDKQRLKEYVDGHGSLHRQEAVDSVIEAEASDETAQKYDELVELFSAYATDLDEDGAHTKFAADK